ncbi:hypothetical protein [Winogradskyella sp. R77965]|uniref:hypothetical protein n=1 Tax=Winogradskyella sp. R77965 TaxID=3093872 RepID=UPI0037DD2DA5
MALLKIEDYTKGELELKTKAFGDNNPITIGKIMADGTIQFNWPEIELSTISENDYWTNSIKNFTGGNFCKDPNAVIDNEAAILVENKYIYVYKYNKPVGSIIPSSQKGQEHNKAQLGTTIDWIYSYTDTNAKANCSEKKTWKELYSFDQTTAYDLKFKKGWNLVAYTLNEIEDYEDNGQIRSLPKTKTIQSLNKMPANLYWHLNYWANDALLEIEQQLITLVPLTKQQYENWLPKKLGKLKRTGYEIGKTLERMPTLNKVNLLFEKDAKKIDLTIVDCANNKVAISNFTLIQDMASRDWKDKTKTGYSTATKLDDTRVIIDYNEEDLKTTFSYNANERFMIKAEAIHIKPEELWEILKNLQLEKLISQ